MRGARPQGQSLGDFNLIHRRAKIANSRRWVGHFEGGLIIGAAGNSANLTLVNRASRLDLLGDLPGGREAENVLARCIELFERVPSELRRTLTWDQGHEMACHEDLDAAVDIDVFFPDPPSPWQQPSNEHFHGQLRCYLGKGTDLSIYSQDDLDVISHRLNTTPRRIFQWESAADRYNAAVVALTA